MKQKRKVKSLISSNGENKNLLTALLFLVGGVLFCGALALFASIGGVASAENSDVIEYPGIDDKKEVLLRFGLIDEGGTVAVNEMFLTGNAFYVNGNAGLSVDGASDMSLGAGKYINFLGGKTDGSNIDSNNVTIIGGNQVKILENNDNTSFLGGSSNTVNPGNDSVSPVMLGGQNNTIGSNQEGSAIIGGRNNEIGGSTSYDFVIGGENNNIGSNSKNAIVGGARVTVNGGNSNLFAFSAGSEFNPKGGNAFYLNVQHGLGLNKAASDLSENNLGVDSNGAVSFGPIDITSSARKCTSDDYGVQGSFEGCLVGCTKLGADNGGKWEMVDHGDKCERLCEDVYSAYCIMSPIEPAKPDPYTSYCTTNGVDTGHSHHCGGEALVLPNYQNVLFETKLIDSDDSCPKPGTNWTENRCVFKCDGEYHLTGDQTGMGGRTKCYKDCKLPWDGTKIKHNETRIAYNTDETYCAFPSGSPASPHTCANHKEIIMCQNGTLYLQKIDPDDPLHARKIADTSRPAITNGYVYSGCMLNQYRCNTDVYNYSASDITSSSKFNDTVTTWNLADRSTTNGTRGVYRLCIDYNTNPNTVQQLNGEKCDALNLNSSVSPKRYTTHYQWVGCRPNYHTGAGYETVCMEDCTLKKTNNQVQYYRHNTTVVGYKTKQETCTSKCESATLVCNDGKWRLGSLNGTQTSAYVYNDCTLKDYTCASRYNVTETEKQAHESTSIYGNSCVPYKANNTDKVTCTAQSTKYELTDCKSGYHTVNGKRCVSNYKEVNCNTTSVWKPDNSHFNVVSVGVYWKSSCGRKGSDATCRESPVDCDWGCDTNYHQEGSNLCCHDGEHSEDGSCTSNTSSAQCIEAGGVANSHYVVENVSITYNEATGTWSTPRNCNWECDEGYTRNGNKCDKDPDPVNGVCSTVTYECSKGNSIRNSSDDTQHIYTWICEGLHGGTDSDLCTSPKSEAGWCKGIHWGCYGGNSVENDENEEEYTWVCEGINGGDDAPCSEKKTCTSSKTCASYGLSSSPSGSCYNTYIKSDGCTNSLTCYENGCSANGYDGYVCYNSVSSLSSTNYEIHALDHGYCVKEKDTVKVKFKIVNNLNNLIYAHEVETGDPVDLDSCGLSAGGETDFIVEKGKSVTSDYSTYTFIAGQTYNLELVYGDGGDCEGNNALCTRAYATFTPDVGENIVTFNVYSETYGPTPGECGDSNNGMFDSKPTSNLCDAGLESSVTTTSTGWVWTCGQGTSAAKCSARKHPKCSTVTFECLVGEAVDIDSISSTTENKWNCENGGEKKGCTSPKVIFGECGTTHYNCKSSLTATETNEGLTEWTWVCPGANGGDDAPCSETCPTGQTIQNGVCKSSPITINICPYVTYDEPQQYGSCYLGNALHNVYYVADRAVPKSISIEATFTYRTLSRNNPSSCSYDSDQKSATYTIEAGNTQSSELQGSRDILHRYETTYSATYGFEKYFDSSFISMSAEVSDTFTYNGQEYIINVKNDACGEIVNTRVDGKCGTNNTPATRCSAGTVSDYDSSTRSRKCVGENGGDTVSCKYSCTTVGGTCECPDGYEMNSSNNCVFVGYKFCAHQLCKCDNFQIGNNNTPCSCIDGTYEGKGSNTCFGDSSQRAKGTIGAWVARIEPYTNSRISADGFDGSNADDEFHLVGFKDESSKCADPYANNLDYLVNNCSSLVRGTNSQLDNGFILKDCSGVSSTAEACCSGGTESCKVMTVGGGSGFEPELLPRD